MALYIMRSLLIPTIGLLAACATHSIPPEALPDATMRGPTVSRLVQEQTIAIGEPLTAGALAAIAVLTNPDLNALRASEGLASAQIFAAGQYPDPSFSFGLDAPLNGSGLVSALTVGLGYDLASLASRPANLRIGQANLDKIRLDIAWAEWLTGEQARLLAARISHLQTIKALTSQARAYADEDLARALRASARGDLAAVAMEVRRLAATDAANQDRSAQLQLKGAQLELNRLLGIDPDELLSLTPPIASEKNIASRDTLFATALSRRADIKGMRASYEGAQAQLELAHLAAYPLPAIGLTFARDTSNFRTFGPSVSFSLPIWNRARGEVAVAVATQAQLGAEYAARLEGVRADIASAYAALEITRAQRIDVGREIQPLLPQLSADDIAAARGDIAASTAAAAHMVLLDKQILEAGLMLSEAELEIALEIAVGQLLETIE